MPARPRTVRCDQQAFPRRPRPRWRWQGRRWMDPVGRWMDPVGGSIPSVHGSRRCMDPSGRWMDPTGGWIQPVDGSCRSVDGSHRRMDAAGAWIPPEASATGAPGPAAPPRALPPLPGQPRVGPRSSSCPAGDWPLKRCLLFLTLAINSPLSPHLTLPRQPLRSLGWGHGMPVPSHQSALF